MWQCQHLKTNSNAGRENSSRVYNEKLVWQCYLSLHRQTD